MKKINIGVIGVGHLGSIHAKIYHNLKEANLVGVCDTDTQRGQAIAREFKTCFYKDYHELAGKIDAASIVVPTIGHYALSRDLLKSNIHLLIEKPITADLAQARRLEKLSGNRKLILQVGHVERFNSALQAVEKICRHPRFIECHRLGPFKDRGIEVGIVLDLMIHDLDIILELVKDKVKKIEAVGVSVLTPYEDIANARITFQGGTVCNLTASRITEKSMRKIRIFEKDTYIALDYMTQEAQIYKKIKNQIIKKDLPIKKEESLKAELKSFLNCIRANKKPLVCAGKATEALEIALKITRLCQRSE